MNFKTNDKKMDVELNLLPFISVLAVCISFLLITAVWVHIGTFNLSQALGTDSVDEANKKPTSLWIHFEENGSVSLVIKNAKTHKGATHNVVIGKSSRANIMEIERYMQRLKTAEPNLNMALLMPAPGSSYEDVVQVMNGLKKNNINEIGIAPL